VDIKVMLKNAVIMQIKYSLRLNLSIILTVFLLLLVNSFSNTLQKSKAVKDAGIDNNNDRTK
jgi:hypothetical protein